MKRHLRIFLTVVVLVLSLTLPISGFAMQQGIAGTFFQPTRAVETWDEGTWDTLFDTYQRLGIREIIVQWINYEDANVSLEKQDHEYSLSAIRNILDRAARHDMRVTVGSVFLSSFWERVKAEPHLVEIHFMRVRAGTFKAIKRIAPQLQNNPAFAGWYISQEIDDRTWLDESYKSVLCSFIKGLHKDLSMLVPDKPISISSFSNAWASPGKLGRFWRDVADSSGVDRVLFQDGVGVNKLSIEEVPIYLAVMQREMQGASCRVQPVLEIFTQLEGTGFRAEPTSAERIRKQMDEESPYAPDGVILFSVAEYMSSLGGAKAEELLQEMLD